MQFNMFSLSISITFAQLREKDNPAGTAGIEIAIVK